jgi:hypothetical protein
MTITDQDPPGAATYYAFLLRLWREADGAAWHASLQAADAQTRRGFADLDTLITYLREVVCPLAQPAPSTPE